MAASAWAVVQQKIADNWQGIIMCWAVASAIFWFMGGFRPTPAQIPPRMRRKTAVCAALANSRHARAGLHVAPAFPSCVCINQ